jgi:cytochrome c oxidase subunit IV
MTNARVSPKLVLGTGIALLAAWAASFALSYVALGAAAIPLALGIAAVKALLVLVFFMELAHERASIRLTLISAFALLSILLGLTVADVLTRERNVSIEDVR